MKKIVIPNTVQVPLNYDIAQCLETIKSDAGVMPLLWNAPEARTINQVANKKSIIDLFDEVAPDILFVLSSHLNESFKIVCDEFDFKYVLIGGYWPKDENQNFVKFSKEPSAIITHDAFLPQDQNIETFFPQTEVEPIVIRHGARLSQIQGAKHAPAMECEVLILTGGMTGKANEINTLDFLTTTYQTKLVGPTIGNHHYLGEVTMVERADFINSAHVLVDFSGQEFWDAAYLKTPAISFVPARPHLLVPKNFKELKENIDSLLNNKMVRDNYIQTCYDDVCNKNTYHHFIAEIFDSIGEQSVGDNIRNKTQEFINDRNS